VNIERLDGDWEKLCYLGEVLPHRTDTGIIYTATQSSAEMVAMFLRQRGMKAEHYHAGRDNSVRQDIEQKFMANQYNVICSTNALGMGIDKQDIRFVVHYHIPASPISYYQEMGRAGRDGKVAWCILLYDPADVAIQEHFLQHDKQKEHYYEKVLAQLSLASQGLSENDVLLCPIPGIMNKRRREEAQKKGIGIDGEQTEAAHARVQAESGAGKHATRYDLGRGA
jgi:ATP-dependent DNA helicase RecQ